MLFGNSSRERTLRENMKINATANGGIQETKEWTYIQDGNKHVGVSRFGLAVRR